MKKKVDNEMVLAVAAPQSWKEYREIQRRFNELYQATVTAVLKEREAVDDFCDELAKGWNLAAIFRKAAKVADMRAVRVNAFAVMDAMGVILMDRRRQLDGKARNN